MFRKLRRRLRPVVDRFRTPVGVPVDLKIPFADVGGADDKVSAILASAEYETAEKIFATEPFWSDSIFSWYSMSLLYALIRNTKPDVVVEIGSFKGKTAFALAHALNANGKGGMHTVGPFDKDHFLPLYIRWPAALRDRTTFYPMNSGGFFALRPPAPQRYDLVLVDGNHDYEFALFDIQCAARGITPGGFIAIDNISQAGPTLAAQHFLRDNPDWKSCGPPLAGNLQSHPYDRQRATIYGTDLMVLQAPERFAASVAPKTFGEVEWKSNTIRGIDTQSDAPVLVQCVFRSHHHVSPAEVVASAEGSGRIPFAEPLTVSAGVHYSAEIWIAARSGTVQLRGHPTPF